MDNKSNEAKPSLLGGNVEHAIKAERGQWYKRLDLNEAFEVVAIDREEECIEIQYYSGEVEELDEASWELLELTPIAPPDNWSGAFGTDNRVEFEVQADSLESALHLVDSNQSD
ncbi:hypothetical protein GCM10009123_20820 [Kangiella japonica]|uniref:Uncharacterized protein n=1 Tax=Kangiella japonica TaxID=647384 RepID=A0ABN0T5U6_9GAMM